MAIPRVGGNAPLCILSAHRVLLSGTPSKANLSIIRIVTRSSPNSAHKADSFFFSGCMIVAVCLRSPGLGADTNSRSLTSESFPILPVETLLQSSQEKISMKTQSLGKERPLRSEW
jgi:hypothetical protein